MANSLMKNLLNSFKQIGILFGAVGLVLMSAYLLTVLLQYMGTNVVGQLGIGLVNNTSAPAGIVKGYVDTGITGILAMAGITSLAAGIGILAVLVQMFGFNIMDRFNISVGNLGNLLKQVATVAGIYTGLIFLVAILRIVFGILATNVTTALGFADTTNLDAIDTLVGTVFTTLFSILSVAVGLLTLAFVAGAFGFEVSIMGSKMSTGKSNKKYDY